MKFKSLLIGVLAGLSLAGSVLGASSPTITATNTEGFKSRQNLVRNSNFEAPLGISFWTASGGTFAAVTTAASVGRGTQSAHWDSSAATQTLTSDAFTIPPGMYAKNAIARCNIQTPSGTATHTLGVWDGSTLTNATTVTSSTAYTPTTINFIMPSSGTIAIRMTSVASNEPDINIDDCEIGLADNISQVSQAQFIGSAYFATTTSCTWARTNAALGAFSTTSACPGPTVEYNPGPGVIQTTDSDLPQVTVNNLPPGVYEVEFTAEYGMGSGISCLAVNDGSTTGIQQCEAPSASTDAHGRAVGVFTYTTAANHTFALWAASSANAVTVNNQTSLRQTYFTIKRFPSTSQQAFSPDQVPASWSGYHDNTCSWARTSTSYGDPTADASCALVERKNRNFGTVSTYTVTNAEPGIVLTFPRSGRYWVCAAPKYAGATTAATMDIRLWDGTTTIAETQAQAFVGTDIQTSQICGIYDATNASTTISLQTRATSGAITIAAGSTNLSAVEWSVVELDAPMPAPLLQGQVVTPSTGVENTIRANMTCSSSSAVNHQDAGGAAFTSIGNIASGKCSIVIPAATFSSTSYDCGVTVNGTAVTGITNSNINNKTSTGFDVYFALISTGSSTIAAATSVTFDIVCRGPK